MSLNCSQKSCENPVQNATVRLDCGHFTCPDCLARFYSETCEGDDIRCSKCAQVSSLSSALYMAALFMKEYMGFVSELVHDFHKKASEFRGEVRGCLQQAQQYARQAMDPETPADVWMEVMEAIFEMYEEYVEVVEGDLSWLNKCVESLAKPSIQLKRKSMDSEFVNHLHWLLVFWVRVSQSDLNLDYKRRTYSTVVHAKEQDGSDKPKTIMGWKKNPGFTWLFSTRMQASSQKQAPFELLDAKQRVSVLDNILKPMPLDLISMVDSLLPEFAGYMTKKLTVSGDSFDGLFCICDDIFVTAHQHRLQFWDMQEMRFRGMVSLDTCSISVLRYLGNDTLAVGAGKGVVMFVATRATSNSDLRHSFTNGHPEDWYIADLLLLRDGRLISRSLPWIQVLRRIGATWHDGVDADLDILIHDPDDDEEDEFFDDPPPVSFLELPDGSLLCADYDGRMRIFSMVDGTLLKTINTAHKIALLASMDVQRFASVTCEGLQIWSTAADDHELQCIRTISVEHEHADDPQDCTHSASYCGNNIIAMPYGSSNSIRLYDVEEGTVVQELKTSVDTRSSCLVRFAGGRLIVFGRSDTDHCFDQDPFRVEEWI